MQETPVLQDFDAATGVMTISFNRPNVFNALDVQTAAAFHAAVADAKARVGLRCVVLTGVGRAFMAGGDVGKFAADLDGSARMLDEILDHMHPALLSLRKIDAPVVAAVNGTAAGAGMSLVLAADYVVAHPAAKFLLAYDKLGVNPDCGGSWFLSRKVGRARAFHLMLMGQMLSAEEAQADGIVNLITSDQDFDEQSKACAARIASGPTKAFGTFKRLMDANLPLAEQLEMERDGFIAATATEDFRNAATAFVQKQPPSFRGA